MLIDRSHIESDTISECAPHVFSAFASDLFGPLAHTGGRFPEKIETTLGNRLPLIMRGIKRDAFGDIQAAVYEQANGCISLKVFNT